MRQQQVDRQPVGERGRVLEGGGRVGVQEPAAVGAQLLDGLHETDRAPGDGLGHPVEASWIDAVPARVCTAPWPTKMMPATKAIGSRM